MSAIEHPTCPGCGSPAWRAFDGAIHASCGSIRRPSMGLNFTSPACNQIQRIRHEITTTHSAPSGPAIQRGHLRLIHGGNA